MTKRGRQSREDLASALNKNRKRNDHSVAIVPLAVAIVPPPWRSFFWSRNRALAVAIVPKGDCINFEYELHKI